MAKRIIKVSPPVVIVPKERGKRRTKEQVEAEREFWRNLEKDAKEKKRLQEVEKERKDKEDAAHLRKVREDYCLRKGIPFPKEWED